MQQSDIDQLSSRIRCAATVLRLSAATVRMRVAAKSNPYWHLQPRVPAGNLAGGQWLAGALGAAASLLPAVINAGRIALQRLFALGRTTAPRLRSVPRRWENAELDEDYFDDETRRIGPYSRQRPETRLIRFKDEREMRRYLGPAGPGREWHHIVEKRLAGRPGFRPELIHSTDNVISLPVEVHRYISNKMSSKDPAYGNDVRRYWVEKMSFADQYDHGLDLIEAALRRFGYDTKYF